MPERTASPRSYALLGNPVEHSLSPRIHNAAFSAAGIDAVYRAVRVDPGELVPRLRALATAGGGGNVTVPHKQAAVQALDLASEAVIRTGAVNTFWLGPGGVHGENTDVIGFRGALAHHGVDLRDRAVLLLGAGGAAAGVLLALLEMGTTVTIVNRTPERARELAGRVALGQIVRCAATPPREDFAAVVNATSLGLHSGDPLPVPPALLPVRATVIDLVYAPGETPWVRAARAAGHQAFDGAEMLLRQAAASFELWTGLPAPLPVMRAALASS